MLALASDEQKLELKKHVNAIHCTNNLTLVQRKLFNALLFNAYADLPYKSQFELPARKLCNLIGYNSNDYGKLKQALLALISTAIEWNVVDYTSSQPAQWSASSAISSAKLENGICTYEYSSLMRELLYRPDIYGRLNMSVLSKFKSSYGLALYENCMRYQGLPQTPWFSVEVFRKLMGVLGNKYLNFKDFKKRVLNIAIDEINQHASMGVCTELKKANQKVISIRFKFTNKSHLSSEQNEPGFIEDDLLVDSLTKNFNLSPETIKELFIKYEELYIREKINMILCSDSYKSGRIRGIGGYLINALKNDYKVNTTKIVSTEKSTKEIELEKQLAKQELENQKYFHNQYELYVRNQINSYLKVLNDSELNQLIKEFEQDMVNNKNILFAKHRAEGLENKAVKACYIDFIKRKKTAEIGELLSFEQFTDSDKNKNS